MTIGKKIYSSFSAVGALVLLVGTVGFFTSG